MAKYIAQNYKSILSAKEIDISSEERTMMDKADTIEGLQKYDFKIIDFSRNPNRKRLKTFQLFKNKDSKDLNNNFKKQYSNMYNHPKRSSKSIKKENSFTNSNESDKNKMGNINRNIDKKRTFTMKYFK